MATPKEEFEAAAVEHGRCTHAGDARLGNRAYEHVIQARRELARLPDQGRSVLAELLSHNDCSVRSWAAGFLLPIEEDKAIAILEEVASGPGLVAFSAEMTLKEWRAGRLVVPQ